MPNGYFEQTTTVVQNFNKIKIDKFELKRTSFNRREVYDVSDDGVEQYVVTQRRFDIF